MEGVRTWKAWPVMFPVVTPPPLPKYKFGEKIRAVLDMMVVASDKKNHVFNARKTKI